MSDVTNVSLALLVKLGSIAVHAEELISPKGHHFDQGAIQGLLQDSEVQEWLAEMSKNAFLPVKR
jgi:vacuolar-type H+-ATPase subunit C/Vma6